MLDSKAAGCGEFANERGRRPRRRGFSAFLMTCAAALACATSAHAGVAYVDDSAPPGGNGASWGTAYRYLSDALAAAAIPANNITEVRIGQGTYVTDQSNANPTGTGLSTASFLLVSGIPVRGGYAGFGSATPDVRDPLAQPTVLTADIGVVGVIADNSYNVLRGSATTTNITLDGLVIRDGNADDNGPGGGDMKVFGGGVHLPNGALTLINCVVESNRSTNAGGGIYVGGALSATGGRFSGNVTTVGTGGAISVPGSGAVNLVGVEFDGNSAKGVGGGVAAFARPIVVSGCTFSDNVSTGPGGYYVSDNAGGAIWADGGSVTINGAPSFFTDNSAKNGGAIALRNASLNATGATFDGQVATSVGGAVWADAMAITLTNCTVTNNTTTIDGGALFHSASSGGSSVTVAGGVFQGNIAGRNGGAIFANQNAILNVSNTTFEENHANGVGQFLGGGAIDFRDGAVTSSTFVANHAASEGGAIGFGSNSAKVIGCTFVGNSAGSSGGAVRLMQGSLIDCLLEGNQAPLGGAIMIRSSSPGAGPFIHSCDVIANTVTASGGGLYIEQGAGLVTATRFAGNHAAQRGGAVYRPGSGTTTLASCLVSGNTAQWGGAGAAGNNGGTLRWVGSTIVANLATANGGGLHSDVGVNEVSSCVVWSNVDSSGAGQSAQLFGPSNWLPTDHSCVQGWTGSLGGVGNFGSDPQLLDIDGADNLLGTVDDTPDVASGSPCDDAGVTTLLPADAGDMDGDGNLTELSPLDFHGGGRVMNFVIDIGAAERQVTLGPGVFVGPSGGSWFTAANWSGGAVPNAATNVYLAVPVVMGSGVASANSVVIIGGGALTQNNGANLTCGSLTVEPGGTFTMNGTAQCTGSGITLEIGSTFAWNGGTLSVADGGTMTAVNPLSFGCGSANAALRLLSGATLTTPSLSLCVRATLRGTGTVFADVINGGTIAPGLSPGALTIDGDLFQSSGGKLDMELGGYASGSPTDTLTVTGAATLDGQLKVTALNTSSPAVVSFTLVNAATINGAFATIQQTDPPGALVAGFRQLPDSIEVGVTSASSRLHVTPGAAVGGAGDSWLTALPDLQSAIVATRLAPVGVIDEVWVAEGTFIPTELVQPQPTEAERSATFLLPPNVIFYGGFAGTEASPAERDLLAHQSILSGDLLGNDEVAPEGVDPLEDNAFRVVSLTGLASVTLDGFVVQGGSTDGGPYGYHGGGIDVTNSAVTIRQCVVTGNRSLDGGAGIALDGGSLLVEASSIRANQAGLIPSRSGNESGGGVRVFAGTAAFTATQFEGNVAGQSGGAVALAAGTQGTFTDCSFIDNAAVQGGAGIVADTATVLIGGCSFSQGRDIALPCPTAGALGQFRGTLTVSGSTFSGYHGENAAAVAVREVDSSSSFSDCVFDGNEAVQRGGAMSIDSAAPTFSNVTFTGNSAGSHGGALWIVGAAAGSPTLVDCEFLGNAAGGNGGAIALDDDEHFSPLPALWLDGGTLSGNSAAAGGAIWLVAQSALLDGVVVAGNSARVADGILCGTGVLRGDLATISDAVVTSGQWRLGQASDKTLGVWTVSGGLSFVTVGASQPVAVFDLALVGVEATSDSVALRGGSAHLDGTLVVEKASDLPLVAGDRFTLIGGGAIVDAFDLALLPSAGPGLTLSLEQSASALELVVERDDGGIDLVPTSPVALSGDPMAMAAGDLDHDGDTDLVVAERPQSGGGPGSITVLRNDGHVDGEWQGFTAITGAGSTGIVPRALVLAHLDGDSFLDVAVANETGSLSILLNAATSGLTFLPTTTVPVGGALADLVAVDAAGPIGAAIDLVVANTFTHELQVFANDGAAGFTLAQSVPSMPATRFLRAGDLDGDDLLEIVEVGTGGVGGMTIYTCGTTLGAGLPVASAVDPTGLTLADVDGDGDLDAVVSSGAAVAPAPEAIFGGSLNVLVNDGGTLSAPTVVPAGIDPLSAAVLDADEDGDGDFATLAGLGSPNSAVLRLARNDQVGPTPVLRQVNDLVDAGGGRQVQAIDVDGDALADLVVASQVVSGIAGGGGEVVVYRNAPQPFVIGDLNRDGAVDGADLAILLGSWGPAGGVGDLTGDGVVDGADLAVLLGAWGP